MKKYKVLCAVTAALLFMLPADAFAQDDETPEQKKLIETLVEREKMAQAVRAAQIPAAPSPVAAIMKEKQAARVGLMAAEEHDVEREASGDYRHGHGYHR